MGDNVCIPCERIKCIIIYMAKRSTGIEKMKKSHSRKTKKRLATKREMLAKRASKRRK